MLIVVTGPIAAGKSTFASHLADQLRVAGRSVAVVGLDEVLLMVRALPDASLADLWDLARTAHADLTHSFVEAGVDVVIAEGPFFGEHERQLLLAELTIDAAPVWITLVVPYEEARRRVDADSGRGISRDPGFLRTAHGAFWAGQHAFDGVGIILDTTDTDPQELAAGVAAHLGAPRE